MTRVGTAGAQPALMSDQTPVKGRFIHSSMGGFVTGAVACWTSYIFLSLTLDTMNDSLSTWLFYLLPALALVVGIAAMANPPTRSFGKGWLWGFLISVVVVFAGAASYS